jgi:XRE family aerobic/anaerobic benzoate catabolism transcriptional regulator
MSREDIHHDPLLVLLGRRIRARRTERELTLRALASECGLSMRFLSMVESGTANISVSKLAQLCRALEFPLQELFRPEQARPAVLALLGLRGAGKSAVGQALATRLGAPFVELDALVEARAGLGLAEIFALHGEEAYRRTELRCLRHLLDTAPAQSTTVLATGGGVVASPEAWSELERRTLTVWLRASPELHMERVLAQGDRRPVQGRPSAMSELNALWRQREPLYARATWTVDTGTRSVEDVVAELVRRLEE